MDKSIFAFLAITLVAGCAGNGEKVALNDTQAELVCLQNNINNADKCLSKETQERVGLRCQYVEVSGTRFKKKECTTLAQRDAKQDDAYDQMRRIQGSGTLFPAEEGTQ